MGMKRTVRETTWREVQRMVTVHSHRAVSRLGGRYDIARLVGVGHLPIEHQRLPSDLSLGPS